MYSTKKLGKKSILHSYYEFLPFSTFLADLPTYSIMNGRGQRDFYGQRKLVHS